MNKKFIAFALLALLAISTHAQEESFEGEAQLDEETIDNETFDTEGASGQPFNLNSLLGLLNKVASAVGENSCMQTFQSEISQLVNVFSETKNLQILKDINQLVAQSKSQCGSAALFKKFEQTFLATDEIETIAEDVELSGEVLLISSQCFQDVGGELVILSTILADYQDIENDVFATIFLAVLGYQGYQDCLPLAQIIESL